MSRAISLVVAMVVLLLFYGFDIDNKIQQSEERITKLWKAIENQYQQRNEHLSTLLKGLAPVNTQINDQKILSDVTAAQEKVLQIIAKQNSDMLYNQDLFEVFIQAQNKLDIVIKKLLVIVEKSSLEKQEALLISIEQLKKYQKIIAISYSYYNKEAEEYNLIVSKFPGYVFAGMQGYQLKPIIKMNNHSTINTRTSGSSSSVDFNDLIAPSPSQ